MKPVPPPDAPAPPFVAPQGGDPVAAARNVDAEQSESDKLAEEAGTAAAQALTTQEPPEPPAQQQQDETDFQIDQINADRNRQKILLEELNAKLDKATVIDQEAEINVINCEQALDKANSARNTIKRQIIALHEEHERTEGRITRYSQMLVDAEAAQMKRPRP